MSDQGTGANLYALLQELRSGAHTDDEFYNMLIHVIHHLQFNEDRFDILELHEVLAHYTLVDHRPSPGLEREVLLRLARAILALCDPYVQPSDTGDDNRQMLSVDLVSDLVLALGADEFRRPPAKFPQFRFAYALNLLVRYTLERIATLDLDWLLKSYPNSSEQRSMEVWSLWLPASPFLVEDADYHDFTVMCKFVIVALMAIFKMYRHEREKCPFVLEWSLYWRCVTIVLLLCLEVDRYHEERGEETPAVILAVAKGMGAIRNILSIYLNDSFDERMHDLKHETLNNFLSVWARKTGDGSLKPKVKEYVDSYTEQVWQEPGEFEKYFEYDDFVEEDLKYMFEFELEITSEDEEEGCATIEFEIHPDCHCEFPDEEAGEDEQEMHEHKVFRTESRLSSVEKKMEEELQSYTDDPKKPFNSTELVAKLYRMHGDPKTSFKPPLRTLFKMPHTSKMISMSDMSLWTFLIDQLFATGDFTIACQQISNAHYSQAMIDYIHQLLRGWRTVDCTPLIYKDKQWVHILSSFYIGMSSFFQEQPSCPDKLLQVLAVLLDNLLITGWLDLLDEEIYSITVTFLSPLIAVSPGIRKFSVKFHSLVDKIREMKGTEVDVKKTTALLGVLGIAMYVPHKIEFDLDDLVRDGEVGCEALMEKCGIKDLERGKGIDARAAELGLRFPQVGYYVMVSDDPATALWEALQKGKK